MNKKRRNNLQKGKIFPRKNKSISTTPKKGRITIQVYVPEHFGQIAIREWHVALSYQV